jgi:hypothetical protein
MLNPMDVTSDDEKTRNLLGTSTRSLLDKKEIKVMEINGTVVHSGFDIKFNSMRVFPPADFVYPDIQRDKLNFFNKIGCPHLKAKYAPKKRNKLASFLNINASELGSDTGNDGFNELMKA